MLKKTLPFLYPIVIFIILAAAYSSPILSGKVLTMHDTTMGQAAAKEVNDFYEKTGEWSSWTNSMFGGMPTFMIGNKFPNSLGTKIGQVLNSLLPSPINYIFLLMLGFYILSVTLGFKKLIGVLASGAFAFGTYNLLFLEAGHVSKILALAYAPVVLAGFVLIFKKRYFLGVFLTALGLALEIYANHLQITYYLFWFLLIYTIWSSIELVKEKQFKVLVKVLSGLAIATIIGVGTHTERLWSSLTYSAETTRGKSELTQATSGKEGLDRDYAFGWSYGWDETGNLLIPNLMGGGTTGPLDSESETYQTLVSGGVPAESANQVIRNLPLYHGEQSITSGPAYTGIVLFFLFVLGLILIKGKWRYLIGGFTLLFILLSLGKNFPSFNNLIFDYLPGYNKFRAVTMTLTMSHMLIALGAAFGLNSLINENEINLKRIAIVIGALIVAMFVYYFGIDYSGLRDAQFQSSMAQSLGNDFAARVSNALIVDREAMAFSDIVRGIFLLLLSFGLIWALAKKKINQNVFLIALSIIAVFELFAVDKRYFNNDDFQTKFQARETFQASTANQQILADSDPNFKVLNLTTSFTQDAMDSYWHKSLGGYHGAKLKRTNELIEQQLIRDGQLNQPVINMLNTKYLIVQGQDGQPTAQLNPNALGNAWFINSLVKVENADQEIASLGDGFDPSNKAYTYSDKIAQSKEYSKDSLASINLTSYAPNKLTYQSNSNNDQFAVFSEMYYRGNLDWLSTIDGKPVDHIKVNYVLRGMEIPAGTHEIVFEFKPKSVENGKVFDLIASIGLVLLLAGAVYFEYKK